MKPTTYYLISYLFTFLFTYVSCLFTFWVCLFTFLHFFAWILVIFVEERYSSRDLFFVVTSKMPNRHVPQINQATAELHRNCRATVRPQRNWPQQSSDGKMMRAASLTFKEILAFFGHKDAYPEMWFLPPFLNRLFGFRIVVIFWNVENVLPIENRCQSTW